MSSNVKVTVSDVGEDALIERITAGMKAGDGDRYGDGNGVVLGPGDDCAVVKSVGNGWWELLKTDAVVAGVHFLPQTPADQVGWKAMARVVSDIGAMGGEPLFALVTLMVPQTCELGYVEQLYVGLKRCADRYGVRVVGGETTSGPVVMISVAMSGRVKPRFCVRRDGAKAGDLIYVTGRLGGSIRGHHLTFEPRVEHGQWLAQHFKPHAMMDLSDGLAKDLPRMGRMSGGLGCVLEEERLPLNEGCSVEEGLNDGEDYELLLAVSPRMAGRLEKAWKERFPDVLLSGVGKFFKGAGKMPLEKSPGGWDHFG